MAATRIIGVEYLKNNSPIIKNVEEDVLITSIQKAQNVNMDSVLGTNLLNAILSKIDNDTLSGDYQTLVVDYVAPALVEWSVYYAMPFIANKMENTGMVQKSGENSTPVDLQTLKFMRDDVRNVAEFYTQKIAKYLCANDILFTEYNTEDEVDETRPNKNNYFSGIYLD